MLGENAEGKEASFPASSPSTFARLRSDYWSIYEHWIKIKW